EPGRLCSVSDPHAAPGPDRRAARQGPLHPHPFRASRSRAGRRRPRRLDPAGRDSHAGGDAGDCDELTVRGGAPTRVAALHAGSDRRLRAAIFGWISGLPAKIAPNCQPRLADPAAFAYTAPFAVNDWALGLRHRPITIRASASALIEVNR